MPSRDNRQRYDLLIYRGADFCKDAWCKTHDPQTGEKIPYDLTGYTAKAQIRPSENSKILTQEISCVITPSEGQIHMEISGSDTAKIPPGFYVWDLQLEVDNLVAYYVYGQVIVGGRVTV